MVGEISFVLLPQEMQLERAQHLSRDIFRNNFCECKIPESPNLEKKPISLERLNFQSCLKTSISLEIFNLDLQDFHFLLQDLPTLEGFQKGIRRGL